MYVQVQYIYFARTERERYCTYVLYIHTVIIPSPPLPFKNIYVHTYIMILLELGGGGSEISITHTRVPNKVRYLTSQHLEGYLLMGNIIVCIANILMYCTEYSLCQFCCPRNLRKKEEVEKNRQTRQKKHPQLR